MKNLLLLHGALGSSSHFDLLEAELNREYKIYRFNFPGHGGESLPKENVSIKLFAEATLSFLVKNNLDKVSVFGYSMGGYVAMYLAKHHSHRIEKVITLATKFEWNEVVAAKEIQMLDPEKIEAKVPAFAEALKQRHAPTDWKTLIQCTTRMLSEMGQNNPLKKEDHESIATPSLIMLGDSDKMVTLEETVDVQKRIIESQLAVLPKTTHPFEQVDTRLLTFFIKRFLG